MTTKVCPMCGNKNLVLLHSQNKKVCTNHKEFVIIQWNLDKHQKPVY